MTRPTSLPHGRPAGRSTHSGWLALALSVVGCGAADGGTVSPSTAAGTAVGVVSGSSGGALASGAMSGAASGSAGATSGLPGSATGGIGSGASGDAGVLDAQAGASDAASAVNEDAGREAASRADSAADGGSASDAAPGGDAAPATGKESIVWIPTYLPGFSKNLNRVTGSPKSFTHVSPDLYQLNFAYSSGAARISGESFDGLTTAQIAGQVHAAGMKLMPLVYAGAGNGGTDQGIQNVLNDSPSGAQSSFIASMVAEGQTRNYDGWNLDFEVQGTGYSQYGTKYVAFLTAFKAALHAQHMTLTIDVGDWFSRQCAGDGLVDLTQIGRSVDRVIIMAYSGTYGSPSASCPSGNPPVRPSCANEFGAQLNLMCDVSPSSAVSIGLIEGSGGSGTNPFLDRALNAVRAIGFTSVAVWPDESTFLNSANIPSGATWYSLLADYLAK